MSNQMSDAQFAAKPLRLEPGAVVRDSEGHVIFRVDPIKKAQSIAAIRQRERKVRASRVLPAPKKSERTKKAVKHASKAVATKPKVRARGVVKHDFGIVDRPARVAKRVQVLGKRLRSRRRSRRRRGANVRPSKQEEAWDRELARQHAETSEESWNNAPPAEGESWWGGLLDTALDLAPHVLPIIAGMGDYEEDDLANQVLPRTNSLAAAFSDGEMCAEVPAIHNIGAETRFTHREYLGDVYSTTAAFSKIEFAVNPGMNETFPWGSRSILNYEQYSLQGAMFVLESEGSEYAAGPGLGWVGLSSTYDVTEAAFYSKRDMFQSQFAVARKVGKSFAHWIECDPAALVLPKKFVRGGPPPASADPHLYDHCRTTLAVGGQATAGAAIGELWITYDLLAMLPRTDESLNTIGIFAEINSTGGVAQATPYGTSWAFTSRDTFLPTMSGNSITFPMPWPAVDMYLVETWWGTPGVGNFTIPAFTGANELQVVPIHTLGNGSYGASTGPAAMGRWSLLTSSGNPVTPPAVTVATNQLLGYSGTSFRAFVVQIPKFRPAPSEIFDPLGAEADRRYAEMRRALEAADQERRIHTRETKEFILQSQGPDKWVVVDKATQRRVPAETATAQSLVALTDRHFDLMCADLCAHAGRD